MNQFPIRASEKNPPHAIHTFDNVGVFNANCIDCQNQARAIARYISPQLITLILQDKKEREDRLKDIDATMANLEAERQRLKEEAERGYGNV